MPFTNRNGEINMLSNSDKIALISSLYQSGSNVSQFLSELDMLDKYLEKNDSSLAAPAPAVECSMAQSGFGTSTQKIIDNWAILMANNSDDPSAGNPMLYNYQEEFLYRNDFSSLTPQPAKFYLGSKGAGLTTIFSIHATRTMMTNPNIDISYISSSSFKIEIFIDAVVSLLPKDMIQTKSKNSVKLTNGSSLVGDTYNNIEAKLRGIKATSLDIALSQNQAVVKKYKEDYGVPGIFFYDNSEDVPFKSIDLLFELGKTANQFFITGHAKTLHSMPHKLITENEYKNIERKIIPWWEIGNQTDFDFGIMKKSFTNEQFLSLYCCQFPAETKEVIKPSKKDYLFDALISMIFRPVLDGEKVPNMELAYTDTTNKAVMDKLVNTLLMFRDTHLTPWVNEAVNEKHKDYNSLLQNIIDYTVKKKTAGDDSSIENLRLFADGANMSIIQAIEYIQTIQELDEDKEKGEE